MITLPHDITSMDANHFVQSTLDALSAHVAILDEHATIIGVNAAWIRFALENGFVGLQSGLGDNYLRVCESASGDSRGAASEVAAGIRAVMTRQIEAFDLEYSCHSPQEHRWFTARVTRFAGEGPVRAVVAHENISDRKRAEEELRASAHRLSLALEAGHLGAFEHSLGDGRVLVSSEFCRILGLPLQPSISHAEWAERMHPDDRGRILGGVERMMSQQTTLEIEYRLCLPNGTTRWVRAMAAPVVREEKVERVHGVVQDITKGKEIELDLRKLSRAVEQSPVSIVITDLLGGIEYVNPKFCALTGYSLEEVRGKTPRVLKSGEMQPETYIHLWDTIIAGQEWRGEFHNRKKNGELYWESASICPIRDDNGGVRHFVAVKEDITERKRADETLKEQLALRERLAGIVANVPGVVYTFRSWPDGSACMPYASPRIAEFIGMRAEDVAEDASPFFDLMHPDDRDRIRESIAESARTLLPWGAEFRVQHPQKGLRWVESRSTPERQGNGSTLWHGFISDVTERKLLATQMEQLRAEHELVLNAIGEGVHWVDVEGRIKFENPAAAKMLGYEACELIGRPGHLTMHHTRADGFAYPQSDCPIYKTFRDGVLRRVTDEVFWRKDGTSFAVEYSCTPVSEPDGRSGGTVVIFNDITERKRAEAALRDSDEKFRQLADNIDDMFWICSPDLNTMHYVSAGYESIWGRSRESLYAQPHQWIEAILPEEREPVAAAFAKLMGSEPNVSVEYRIARPDGTFRWVHARGFQVRDAAGNLVRITGIATDITERKRTAQELVDHKQNEERSRRALQREHELNQIKSRFVRMVSHEFRTPLCVIAMAASLLERYSDRMTAVDRTEQLVGIQSAVERMTQMMEDLLLHGELEAGNMECSPSRVDVEVLCRQIVSGIPNRHAAPHPIACVIAPDAREAFLDAKILRAILTNLLGNAVKYSLKGQPVKIDVARVAGNGRTHGGMEAPAEDHLQLKISDSGIGIPAADLSKLFQTFHRASNVGNRPGTGMGLAIVKHLVDLHRGTIQVESQEGKGTTACVSLPITSSGVTGSAASPEGSALAEAGRRTPEF